MARNPPFFIHAVSGWASQKNQYNGRKNKTHF